MKKIILLSVAVIMFLGIGTFVGMYFSYNNKEIALRNQVEAQRGKIEGDLDMMWKVISQ